MQRSLALGRAAAARGHTSVILSNSPVWPRVEGLLQIPGVRVEHLEGGDSLVAEVDLWLSRDDFDVLIVDTLPRGLLGEVVVRERRAATVFVHRDLKPEYAGRANVQLAVREYDLVLCPGERGSFGHPRLFETEPWVLFDEEDLLDRESARSILGYEGDRYLVVVCDATDPSEASGLQRIAADMLRAYPDEVHVLRATLESTWPLMRLHLGIDLIVGAGGYNTVYEARLTGTPLRAIPRARLYDRQERRLRPIELLDDVDLPQVEPRRETVAFTNGAHFAVDCIEDCVSR